MCGIAGIVGAGFVGSHVVEELERIGCRNLFIPRFKEYDLTHPEAVVRPYDDARPQLVIHLAATVGGIGANRENPGRFFYENLMMGAQPRRCRRSSGCLERSRPWSRLAAMAHAVPIPPAGFDDLSADEKVRYVEELWDHVAADLSKVPIPDWHRRLLEERLAEYNADPEEGQPWSQVRDRLLRELAEPKRGRD